MRRQSCLCQRLFQQQHLRFKRRYPLEIYDLQLTDELLIKDLLQPIEGDSEVGPSLKESELFAEILSARSADDPGLPRGVWEHDLKRSDWEKVADLSLCALKDKTKDIQLAIWYLEAQVRISGLENFAVGTLFISELIETFWDNIHPVMLDGDVEYRTNLFSWMNERLPDSIRHIPFSKPVSGEPIRWLEWERAFASTDDNLANYRASMKQTEIDFYQNLWEDLSDALYAVEYLTSVLAKQLGDSAPTMTALSDFLVSIMETIEQEIGFRPAENDKNDDSDDVVNELAPAGSREFPQSDRQQAYAMLAEAASFLMRDDPHSPAPYLVFKAIEWGTLSTSELYEELFVKCGGNVNIFELLGIEQNTGEKRR